MRLLFLRGRVDERTQRVRHLEDSTDMWTHLAAAMGDEVKILYEGPYRKVYYGDHISEEWVSSFAMYPDHFRPDVIFARGGFSWYKPILGQHPEAFRVYYAYSRASCAPEEATRSPPRVLDAAENIQ